MFSYQYSKTPICLDRLTAEIQQSSIVAALCHLQLDGISTLTVVFKAELTEADKSVLDTIITNHTGQPLDPETPSVVISEIPALSPYTSKTIEGKKLFKRVHGIQASVTTGTNTLLFTIPYSWVKITSIQCVGGEVLDMASLFILDSTTGTYSTIPNYPLNQFGYSVNVAPVFHEYKSSFDADLYQGMQIKIVYTSVSNKTIGVNFILDEVK